MSSAEFTVIVPLYNEEESLQRLGTELSKFISQASVESEVLFVNDGSSDNSQALLEQLCTDNPSFHFIQFEKNCGLSAAIKAGFENAVTQYVGYIDADLQTTPMDFNLLLTDRKEYDLVTGVRANRKDSALKLFSSKVANGIRRSFTNDGATDTGCPLKVFKTASAKKIPFFNGGHRFFPALIKMTGGKVKEIPVQHFPRVEGKSKYGFFNRLVGPFHDLFAFRWMRKRYIDYRIKKKA